MPLMYNQTMAVTIKDVEHVAKLARLGLSEKEKETLVKQLSAILDYAETINKLDTKNVAPTSHAIPMKNVFRQDELKPFEDIKAILANAPDERDNMFSVPKIME
jgi:aspartyl-tRNA(Asn)/glutamyl-tRNA(Gln) amidotransferase subunit C